MRVFPNLQMAISEIERDIYKSAQVQSTRVQQWDNLDLQAHEAIGYTYAISPGGIPENASKLVDLGIANEFPVFRKTTVAQYVDWLLDELNQRLSTDPMDPPAEKLHPNLEKVYEGTHPSYTYRERLVGMIDAVVATLKRNPDSRRAYWPIFIPQDAHRAMASTRVPCSLGYHFFIRQMPDETQGLYLIYYQRSSDFENFWLSDVWFANQIQKEVARQLGIPEGVFIHSISSFHSFEVGSQEIY